MAVLRYTAIPILGEISKRQASAGAAQKCVPFRASTEAPMSLAGQPGWGAQSCSVGVDSVGRSAAPFPALKLRRSWVHSPAQYRRKSVGKLGRTEWW